MISILQTSVLCLTASLWMMVSVPHTVAPPTLHIYHPPSFSAFVEFYSLIFFFCVCVSQTMIFFPSGSGPDQFSIPPDCTMPTPWTFTTTKTEGPLPMTSMQTAGKQPDVKIYENLPSCFCRHLKHGTSTGLLTRSRAAFLPVASSLLLLPLQLLSVQCTHFKNRWKRTCCCL